MNKEKLIEISRAAAADTQNDLDAIEANKGFDGVFDDLERNTDSFEGEQITNSLNKDLFEKYDFKISLSFRGQDII